VTITPYGPDVEPNVPSVGDAVAATVELSRALGPRAVSWRYDPIILNERYTRELHAAAFAGLCAALEGVVRECVVSFLQIYAKTERNFPGAREATAAERRALLEIIVPTARARGIAVRTCADYPGAAIEGLSAAGCVTRARLRDFAGIDAPPMPGGPKRERCRCDLPSRDIGAYNSCPHGCKYCYANHDMGLVARNYGAHDPDSPLLIGHVESGDVIVDARQESFRRGQLSLDLFGGPGD